MEIDNPPSPPFSKRGMGGFEIYFLSKKSLNGKILALDLLIF
jgi:hypothetical protein